MGMEMVLIHVSAWLSWFMPHLMFQNRGEGVELIIISKTCHPQYAENCSTVSFIFFLPLY